jgi:hypothetical protein
MRLLALYGAYQLYLNFGKKLMPKKEIASVENPVAPS